ncbi:MAG: hypothetical protein HY650_01745 [Acidobacteria bacterium]|nr:hypothetical protein [Acidobacteriota bacterium]
MARDPGGPLKKLTSARITVVLYILVFFELGAVLIISPRSSYWAENMFLAFLVERTKLTGLALVINSSVVRWGVIGLGVINVLLGLWEAFHFKDLIRLMAGEKEVTEQQTTSLSDHGS